MIFRIGFFVFLILIVVYTPLWVIALFAFLYAILFFAWDLIFLALLVDALYGGAELVPYYTLSSLLLLFLLEWVKPRLLMYNQ